MAMTPADKELVQGCLSGDKTVQDNFVRTFSRLVFSTIHSVFKSKGVRFEGQDAEDLHNTVFVALFEKRCLKLRRFEGKNGCSLASWIRMITVRAVLDHLRRGKDPLCSPRQLRPLESIVDLQEGSSPWTLLADKEQSLLLERGLEKLSARDQLLIRLHCLEERPLAHVADILKVSESNIHSVKHRAVRRLKAAVTEVMQR